MTQGPSEEKKENQKQPDDTGSAPSELEEVRKELASVREELKRTREEKLDQRTDPNYIKKVSEDRRKQREAKILNQRLPQGRRLTKEQMEDMSNADIIALIEQRSAEVYNSIQQDKINPIYEQTQDDKLQSGLKQLNDIDKDWVDCQEEMLPIARAQPDLPPVEVYMAALAMKKDWKRLDAVREKLSPKPKDKTEEKGKMETEKETTPKDVSAGGRPNIAGGEKPSASVTSIKPPSKPMTSKEAATKAYEQVFENQGTL